MTQSRWKRVKALFNRALDRTNADRGASLVAEDEAPSVLAEARRLIDADARNTSFLPDLDFPDSATVLSNGETVAGRYRVLSLLARGGMSSVYWAEDTVLGRNVALKFLSRSLSESTQALEQLRREARAAAGLNHPNICVVYEIAEDQGRPFIVMEFLEGHTLKLQIGARPLDINELLDWAAQIAGGLEAAHRSGIVHRDIKPQNIFITTTGQAKILDFGLAKTFAPVKALEKIVTASGIVGTVPYMSPEQARGETLDTRTDLFSFGAVLFEMATGRPAFAGETPIFVLDAILRLTPPPASQVNARIPWELDRIIAKALEKDRDLRFQSAADLLADLKALKRAGTGTRAPLSQPLARRSTLPWAVAILLGIAFAFTGWGWYRAAKTADRTLERLDVDLGPEVSLPPVGLNHDTTSSVIISPDGTRIVYIASVSGGPRRLYTRRLDQTKATELPGTDGVTFPFFSPDGHWVGFATSNKLKKISVDGGAVVTLGDILIYGASWGEGESILFDGLVGHGLASISSGGGAVAAATSLARGDVLHAYPHVLPGGKAVVFTSYKDGPDVDKASIEVASLVTHQRKTLVQGGTSPHYLPSSNQTGYLLYSNKGTLFAVSFDLGRLETRGNPVPVLDDVAYEPLAAAAQFDVSRSGTLVYRKAGAGRIQRATVQWLSQTGKQESLLTKSGIYESPSLSPNGRSLAIVVGEGASKNIWVYDKLRDTMTRLTSRGLHFSPVWSRSGRYVLFGSDDGSLSYTRADGAGQPQLILRRNQLGPSAISLDGKKLTYVEQINIANHMRGRIWTVPIEELSGELKIGTPQLFRDTPFSDCCAVFSPDARWLAYASDESGKLEVYVRPFPPSSAQSGQWQISTGGGESPIWSSNDRQLLYHSHDQIMSVKYTVKGDVFLAEKPRIWAAKLDGATDYDLSSDGKRVALVMPVPADASTPEHQVGFLFNLVSELRRRVP